MMLPAGGAQHRIQFGWIRFSWIDLDWIGSDQKPLQGRAKDDAPVAGLGIQKGGTKGQAHSPLEGKVKDTSTPVAAMSTT